MTFFFLMKIFKNIFFCLKNHLQQKTGEKCQIINLGCGFDTLYWRLRDAGHLLQNFIELDFPTVTAKKCYQIKRNKVLLDKIHAEGKNKELIREPELLISFLDGEIRFSPTDLHATNYHIVGVDLRSVDEVSNKLKQSDVDFNVPTIFLGESLHTLSLNRQFY